MQGLCKAGSDPGLFSWGNRRMRGSSVPFVAAGHVQNGFVQTLTEELAGTTVRVTTV